MSFTEDELLPLSGLQHLVFCERQCALIHVEGIWIESDRTVEGRALHEQVDLPGSRNRPGARLVRALPLRSFALGLSGRADLVEFHLDEAAGREVPFPVEYKRGKKRPGLHDEVQLVAQALCLEEMLGVPVVRGAIFHGESRRRREVVFDEALRGQATATAARFHELMRTHRTPPPVRIPGCRSCSLAELCLPDLATRESADDYLHAVLRGA